MDKDTAQQTDLVRVTYVLNDQESEAGRCDPL